MFVTRNAIEQYKPYQISRLQALTRPTKRRPDSTPTSTEQMFSETEEICGEEIARRNRRTELRDAGRMLSKPRD